MNDLATILVAAALAVSAGAPQVLAEQPGSDEDQVEAYVAVFDFAGAEGNAGKRLADSLRLSLRRQQIRRYHVIDRLTMQEVSRPLGINTKAKQVTSLMTERLAANLSLYGTVTKMASTVKAEVRCIDLRGRKEGDGWTKVFTDNSERWRAVMGRAIAEAVVEGQLWKPPEYGDEPEPKNFAKPINLNGGFDKGHLGWDPADNVSTFLMPGPKGRGRILRVRTDLMRGPWLRYRRALRFGQADPNNPPRIGKDTSFSSVAGLEGVHYRSDWIRATPGQRYWLLTDHKGPGGSKIFIKGFMDTSAQADGLTESALARLGLTPRAFARLPQAKRKKLIADEAKRRPEQYRREVYRWYLNCAGSGGRWKHFAAPFPPRGGLPKKVRWIQIQVYSYWPPGDYFYDNVHLYRDPTEKAPLAEEKPRTPNYAKERSSGTKPAKATSRPRSRPAAAE